MALITDGRFSGATRGASIGHVSPEAASGGPIGLVEEGDLIAIDIPAHSITLKVSDEELAARKAKWVCPEPKIKTGYLARYAKMVSSAARGCRAGVTPNKNAAGEPLSLPRRFLLFCYKEGNSHSGGSGSLWAGPSTPTS